MDFLERLEIAAICTKKNTFLIAILLKLTLDNILIEVKKSPRAAPPFQISWNSFQIQITPLLWQPQDPQGCLKKWNYALSSNFVVWCAKIGPKTQKLRKPVKKWRFFDFFFKFLRFFEVSGFKAQFQRTKPPNSNSVDEFASLDTPGVPRAVKVVEWNIIQLLRSLCGCKPS